MKHRIFWNISFIYLVGVVVSLSCTTFTNLSSQAIDLVKPGNAVSEIQPSGQSVTRTPTLSVTFIHSNTIPSVTLDYGEVIPASATPYIIIPSATMIENLSGLYTPTPIFVKTPTPIMAITTMPTLIATENPYHYTPPPWVRSELKATEPGEVSLDSGKYQLIEFFAFWCGTCQAMAGTVHGLEAQYGERVNFIYLDIDNPANDQLKELLHYKTQPHFILVDEKGVVVKEWLGYVSPSEFIEAFEFSLN